MTIKYVPLIGAGMSGRAVKCRLLSGAEKHDVLDEAAREFAGDPEAPMLSLRDARARLGAIKMIVAVSKQTLTTLADRRKKMAQYQAAVEAARAAEQPPPEAPVFVEVTSPDLEWIAVSQEDLRVTGPKTFDKLFSAKEQEVLTELFQREHDCSRDDVEAILGNVVALAENG